MIYERLTPDEAKAVVAAHPVMPGGVKDLVKNYKMAFDAIFAGLDEKHLAERVMALNQVLFATYSKLPVPAPPPCIVAKVFDDATPETPATPAPITAESPDGKLAETEAEIDRLVERTPRDEADLLKRLAELDDELLEPTTPM